MQNKQRFSEMEDMYGLPWIDFCNDYNFNNKRNRLLQRHLCPKKCFWNPELCFWDKCHSGDLPDLMSKSFHEKFGPLFKSQFDRKHTPKIDWSLTGGVGNFPSRGLKNLIESLGISTKLSYDDDKNAINFDNLSREFRDSDPARPLYIMEEKKCHDVIEGLLNVNTKKIQSNRKESETVYTESFNFSGTLRKPILSLMMWGPATNLRVKQAQQKCDLDNSYSYSGLHVCGNFSEKHYWMYSHGDKVSCNSGSIEKLCGPVMPRDMKVIYPCNKSVCNQDCLCPFCQLSTECLTENHKKQTRDFDQECHVQRDSQCQEHWVKHPETFNAKEDVMVEKNIFYHKEVLVKNPRIYFVEKLEFAGIPQKCITCCQNVETHLKEHKVIHLQCKFCLHQLRTAFDKKYWDKVCSICGKILPDQTRERGPPAALMEICIYFAYQSCEFDIRPCCPA